MTKRENIGLAQYTTLRLGGEARYFCECTSVDEVKEALQFARSEKIPIHILGGGSNTIFSDDGYRGVVIKIDLRGITFEEKGNDVIAAVKAGESWEEFVSLCVEKGYGGIECLSGIPGNAGATPIQNVGAYGQEVKDTIDHVTTLETETMNDRIFQNGECEFAYRSSRFKYRDSGKYIVTEVSFRLKKNGRPTINYPEVKRIVDAQADLSSLADGKESLAAVRQIVLSLRRKKSMVIDPADSNSRSAGSFFMNPIVSAAVADDIKKKWAKNGDGTAVPMFPDKKGVKIPAAWLVERSGFTKGYTVNGAGISENHTLALVNRGGTAASLLALAKEIQDGVQASFGILLQREPVFIQ